MATFHTYSTCGRGDACVDTIYTYLDLAPKGPKETSPADVSFPFNPSESCKCGAEAREQAIMTFVRP
jgi:predicted dithiol-disulfide oxidoreductase (DUF899 family)